MGVVLKAVGTLLSIAAMEGLTRAIDWLEMKKASNQKVTSYDIDKAIKQLTSAARKKGADVLDRVNDQIANANIYITSPGSKEYIRKAQSKLSNRKSTANKMYNDIVNKADQIDSNADTLKYSSDSYRASSMGKEEFNDLKTKASGLSNELSKLQGVENYV